MHKGLENALELLPEGMQKALGTQIAADRAEEIRLRCGREPAMVLEEGERAFAPGHIVSAEELMRVLDRASGCSLHSVQDELKRGFITARGGVRVGVCGSGVGKRGLEGLRDISSLAIRIPRQVKMAGSEAMAKLRPYDRSVLIISPPGGGKTTFLRELVRESSDAGRRVALCDERGEVAALWQGRAGFELGRSTDVLTGVDKAAGVMMLLRAMNPQVIALDEVSGAEDAAAVESAANCGAVIFATAHGANPEQMRRRPIYARLLDTGIFEKAVVISGMGNERRYEVVSL